MQAVLKSSKQLEPMLEWCLIASLLAHALILFGLPKPQMDTPPPKRDEIKIELVQPAPPAPAPVMPPPTPQPEPVKPPPKPITPKPLTPTPVPQKVTPISEPPTESPRQVAEPTPPSVIAVKSSVSESKPELVVPPPPPEPVKPSGPSEGDYEAARAAFREAAQREIQKNLRYPRMALERGIEGITHLHISFDDQGNIDSVEVTESSGNKALDEAAISTIRKSQFKALFNDILRGRLKSTNVPVSFKLVS